MSVRALIAHTNSGGEKTLRKLELRLLEQGVTVSRTADNLVRYHGKMIIVDNRVLHVYGFNFTGLDIERSRSFGIMTKNPKLVQEAGRLLRPTRPVSPICPRAIGSSSAPRPPESGSADFIKGARRELLIYDPKVSDGDGPSAERARREGGRGADHRQARREEPLTAEKYPGRRLHVRAIVRDGRHAFVGSQSLRKIELERRREVGDHREGPGVVKQIQGVFEGLGAHRDGEEGRPESREGGKKGREGTPRARSRRTIA